MLAHDVEDDVDQRGLAPASLTIHHHEPLDDVPSVQAHPTVLLENLPVILRGQRWLDQLLKELGRLKVKLLELDGRLVSGIKVRIKIMLVDHAGVIEGKVAVGAMHALGSLAGEGILDLHHAAKLFDDGRKQTLAPHLLR